MIKLCDSAITILNPDGSRFVFELEELQSRIIKSCLAAGIRDVWIAEDISLSIEYALTPATDDGSEGVFTLLDLNSIVVKILEQTGYPEVAEHYRIQNEFGIEIVKTDLDSVVDVIENQLGLRGDILSKVVKDTSKALELLSLDDVAPSLILELGKHYKATNSTVDEVCSISVPATPENGSERLSFNSIYAGISESTKKFVESKILQFSGVSPLYPAIKIDLRIAKLANELGLDTPLTEMAVIPHFYAVAQHINEIIAYIDQLYTESKPESDLDDCGPLPIYLNVRDMSTFAKDWMMSSWPDAHGCCEDMLYYLERDLLRGIFKLQLT